MRKQGKWRGRARGKAKKNNSSFPFSLQMLRHILRKGDARSRRRRVDSDEAKKDADTCY